MYTLPKDHLVGAVFDRLTVKAFSHKQGRRFVWHCDCACGAKVFATTNALRAGKTKSCGCMRRDRIIAYSLKHGLCRSSVYRRWSAMIDRCTRPGAKQYKDYGGRGIKVCAGYRSFDTFFSDLGHPPTGYLLDRRNNDEHYSCGKCEDCLDNGWAANVHWVTRQQSARNTRSNTRITINGQTRTIAEWAEVSGISYSALETRHLRKKPLSEFLNPNHARWGNPLTVSTQPT